MTVAPSSTMPATLSKPKPVAGRGRAGGTCKTPQTVTTGIHFLSFTTQEMTPRDVETMLHTFYQGAPVHRASRGLHGYEHGVRFPNSTWVCWSEGRSDVFVQLPGDACEEVGLQACLNLVASTGGRVSRVDVAIDGAPFTPRYLARKYREGAVRTAAQKANFRDGYGDGDTFYLGRRSSSRYLRCYDRNTDADGNRFTRMETEYKHHRAQKVWAEIAALENLEEGFPVLAMGLLRDFLDIIKPTDSNVSRCPLNRIWEGFTQSLGKVKTVIPRARNTLEKSIEWLTDTVSPTLATVAAFYEETGHDAQAWLGDLLTGGAARMRDTHQWKLQTALHLWGSGSVNPCPLG